MFYVVQAGDTLTSIASRYHVTIQELVSWNNISDPNLIYPGQRILTSAPPALETVTSEFTPSVNETIQEAATTVGETVAQVEADNPNVSQFSGTIPVHMDSANSLSVYVVRPGDTLSEIASQYGTTFQEIADRNAIINPNLIYPGQRLVISNNLRQNVTLYDSVNADAIPPDAQVVAGYIDGKYAWTQIDFDKFPNARVLRITVTGQDGADVLDVENGDVPNSGVAGWVARNPGKYVYTSRFNWPLVRAALQGANLDHLVKYWIADWTNVPHMLDGANFVQWTSSRNFDVSEGYL